MLYFWHTGSLRKYVKFVLQQSELAFFVRGFVLRIFYFVGYVYVKSIWRTFAKYENKQNKLQPSRNGKNA